MSKIKLYTYEQVKIAIDMAHNGEDGYYGILSKLTPIELPSDEEIEEGLFHQSNEYAYGYKDAFKSVIEQIKQQDNGK